MVSYHIVASGESNNNNDKIILILVTTKGNVLVKANASQSVSSIYKFTASTLLPTSKFLYLPLHAPTPSRTAYLVGNSAPMTCGCP